MTDNIMKKIQDQVKTVQSNIQATRSSLIAGRSGDQRLIDTFTKRSGGGLFGFGFLKGTTTGGTTGDQRGQSSTPAQERETPKRRTIIVG